MEAMALGVPVAAFGIPGIDKLIINEKTGLIVEFGDIEGLKRCWERILFEKDSISELVQNARRHVVENLSAKRMAEQYTKLYQEMVEI